MCGIFGVFGLPQSENASERIALGLHALQHRGSDFVGIATVFENKPHTELHPGTVARVFMEDKHGKLRIDQLKGQCGIGHVRYPTVDDNPDLVNIQPVTGWYGDVPIAVAHNGNVTNKEQLKLLFPELRLFTTMDTELIVRLLEMFATGDIEADLVRVFSMLSGSITLGVLLPDRLIGIRDKSGNRPLHLGKIGEAFCIASEDIAFPSVHATRVMSIKPGTMVVIDRMGFRVRKFAKPQEHRCALEPIYFMHQGSTLHGGITVGDFRRKVGGWMQKHYPVPGADIVTGVPFSAIPHAQGYGSTGKSGIFEQVIFRNLDRTFTALTQAIREAKVVRKFVFSARKIKKERIVVIEDSIVRGTTMPGIVKSIRECRAKAVHGRVMSPPIINKCPYGINIRKKEELLATGRTVVDMRVYTGLDSLWFLPLKALKKLLGRKRSKKYCFACMDNKYW